MSAATNAPENPVLHVVVIGFHHKKGCQVEYSYPPLIEGGEVNSHDAPPEWKNLPSLAVPDGAHNYVKDTIYFHLPAREGSHRTVYGVACYRQIDSHQLKNRTTDITRSTVQKSVCVLSYLPLYGLIQAKLELITHAYFQELDFSQVSLLQETYTNLNMSLTASLLDGGSQVYLDMNVKDLIHQFRHKIMLIFKLILLERRVLFTGTPVGTLGNVLLSVLSLFPGMIEHGLVECTTYGIHKHISPTMKNTNFGDDHDDEYLEIRYTGDMSPEIQVHGGGRVARSNSVEPQSPTIERDADFKTNTPLHVQYNCDKSLPTDVQSQADTCDSSKPINDRKHKVSETDSLKYIEDHYTKDKSSQELSCDPNQPILLDKNKSHDQNQQILLADSSQMMMGVTQYEAVQAGKCIPKNGSVINIEDYSQSLDIDEDYFGSISERATIGSAPGELSVSLEDLNDSDVMSVKRTDSVGELDSPESIDQIDQEDCFSWEDDKLSLAIDTDKSSPKLDDTSGLASSFKEVSVLERNISNSKTGTTKSLSRSNSSEVKNMEPVKLKQGNSSKGDKCTKGDNSMTPSKDSSRDTSPGSTTSSPGMKAAAIKNRLTNAFSGLSMKKKGKSSVGDSGSGSAGSSEPPSPVVEDKSLPSLPVLHQDNCGLPLAVFTKGCVCFPYLSLQYFDLLNDVNVRSFVIGATNVLFKQKRHLTDVVIDVNENKIDIHDKELQKQLTLTTADLRFADILVKAVTGTGDYIYLDGTEWEGNDEWLRAQFRVYLESMLATMITEDVKLLEDYGSAFIQTWKTTHNYRVWSSVVHPGVQHIQTGHPCQGHLGMADIKVRLAHTMQNTEGGKKINAAVTQTGKYVVQTGKAVGGALTSAKTSLSSWFTGLTSEWKGTDKVGQNSTTDKNTDKNNQNSTEMKSKNNETVAS